MSFTALGCKVDPLLRSVTDASGRTTRLEPKACDLLVLLAGRPGEVISVEQLIESVWGGRFVTFDRGLPLKAVRDVEPRHLVVL